MVNGAFEAGFDRLVIAAHHCLEGEIISPITYSGASCRSASICHSMLAPGTQPIEYLVHQKRMLGDGESMFTHRLPIPARNAGKAMRNILDFNIER